MFLLCCCVTRIRSLLVKCEFTNNTIPGVLLYINYKAFRWNAHIALCVSTRETPRWDEYRPVYLYSRDVPQGRSRQSLIKEYLQ